MVRLILLIILHRKLVVFLVPVVGLILLFVSLQHANATTECVTYNPPTQTIEILCDSMHLSDVATELDDPLILSEQESRTWILSATIVIPNDTSLIIDSSDTDWLKIRSDGTNDYGIRAFGDLLIDSVKITSWNTLRNDYALTDGQTPRPYLTAWEEGTGHMDIQNSEIAYLGYDASHKQGISYYSADGSNLKNNEIHHMWYGFYSNNVGFLTLEDNEIHNNEIYGVDPHTGTHDMMVRRNVVHDTVNGIGIICSQDCFNINIEDNETFNNKKAGIVLSRNTYSSQVKNNFVHDELVGISVSDSSDNLVFNNTVQQCATGIQIQTLSYNTYDADSNRIFNNTLTNNANLGINVQNGATNTEITDNTIDQIPSGVAIIIENRITTNTTISGNSIKSAGYGIVIRDNDSTLISRNSLEDVNVLDYYITNGSKLYATDSFFINDRVRTDSGNSFTISNSGELIYEGNQIDTDRAPYELRTGGASVLNSIRLFNVVYGQDSYTIHYALTGNIELGNVTLDTERKSLVIGVPSSFSGGTLMSTIPRKLIDADDGDFQVYFNQRQASFVERSVDDTSRTIEMTVPPGTENITIRGTQVIPEFPSSVLVFAVISLVLAAILTQRRRRIGIGGSRDIF